MKGHFRCTKVLLNSLKDYILHCENLEPLHITKQRSNVSNAKQTLFQTDFLEARNTTKSLNELTAGVISYASQEIINHLDGQNGRVLLNSADDLLDVVNDIIVLASETKFCDRAFLDLFDDIHDLELVDMGKLEVVVAGEG